MREMKDSGVEWVGELPKDWKIVRVSHLFGNRNNPNREGKETNRLSLSYGQIVRKDTNSGDGLLPESFNTYNIVEPGDIIIRPTDLQNDKKSLRTGLSTNHGIITSAYIALKPIKKQIDSRYYHYLLHSYDVEKVFYNMGNGVRQGLTFSLLAKLPIIKPSIVEQQSIANYLDSKCSQIDSIIEKTQQEIEKLKEYRQSIITEAVTKGLDPDVEMKDSGIEWIGMIPKNWRVVPIKRGYQVTLGKMIQSEQKKPDESLENYLCAANVKLQGLKTDEIKKMWISPSEKEQLLLKSGDVLVTEGGATAGEPCMYDGTCDPCFFQNSVNRIRPKDDNDPQFVLYWMSYIYEADLIDAFCNQATFTHYTKEKVEQTPTVLPPIDDQTKIAEYLNAKIQDIKKASNGKVRLIDKLQQYKKSLIYECVTGKKEVPSNVRSV